MAVYELAVRFPKDEIFGNFAYRHKGLQTWVVTALFINGYKNSIISYILTFPVGFNIFFCFSY